MSLTTPLVRLRILPALLPVDGINADIRVSPDGLYLQKKIGLGAWENLVALDALQGPIGPETELRSNGGYVQWRPKGSSDTAWRDLFALSEIGGGNGGGSGGGPVAFADITGKPTTLGGYGITDGASQSDLSSGLAGKANTSHTHAISAVTGLQSALDSKAATSHTQAISTITGLQSALDGKSPLGHTHSISDVTGLTTALAGKESTANKGQPSGYASLGSDGKVPAAQLPAVDSGSSDAASVIYYPAPSIAVPVAQRLGQEVSLLDGWASGVTDYSDLMDANLARAAAARRPLVIPGGLFPVSRKFTAAGAPISIFGFGMTMSALEWQAGASDLGLDFSFNGDEDFAFFEDFGLYTKLFNQGTGLRVSFADKISSPGGDPVILSRFQPTGRARGLLLRGSDGTLSNGFQRGILVDAPLGFNVQECHMWGASTGADPNYASEDAIYLGKSNGYGHPVESLVQNNRLFRWKRAIVFEGMEGCFAEFNNGVGVGVGIDFMDVAGRPHLDASHNHFNVSIAGVRINAASQAMIANNLIYHVIGANQTGYGVNVSGPSQHITIVDNQFESAINSSAVFEAITIFKADHGKIDGNTFRPAVQQGGQTVNMKGITLGNDARFFKVGDENVFEDTRSGRPALLTQVSDGGVSNRVPGMGARYSKSNDQGITGGTPNTISWELAGDLKGNMPTSLGPTGGGFSVPSDGVYEFTAGVVISDNGQSGGNFINITKNGQTANEALSSGFCNAVTGGVSTLSVATGRVNLLRGDMIYVTVNPGGSRSALVRTGTFFNVRRVA